MSISSRVILIAAAFCLQAAGAQSATLTHNVRSAADDRQNSSPGVFEQRRNDVPTQLVNNIGIQVEANDGRPLSSAGLNVDAATGQVKFGSHSFAQGRAGQFFGSSASAISEFELAETFSTTGSGSVTFVIDIDGTLNETGPSLGGNARVAAYLNGFAVGNRPQEDKMFATTGLLGVGSHFIQEQLAVTLNVAGGNSVRMVFGGSAGTSSDVQTETAIHDTSSDFFNTATISFFTTGDLMLMASDPDFLSGGATSPAPVPVPASLPLLVGALGLFGATKLRKRKA